MILTRMVTLKLCIRSWWIMFSSVFNYRILNGKFSHKKSCFEINKTKSKQIRCDYTIMPKADTNLVTIASFIQDETDKLCLLYYTLLFLIVLNLSASVLPLNQNFARLVFIDRLKSLFTILMTFLVHLFRDNIFFHCDITFNYFLVISVAQHLHNHFWKQTKCFYMTTHVRNIYRNNHDFVF